MPTKLDAAQSEPDRFAEKRFAELIRDMLNAGEKEGRKEGAAALAVFFHRSVTAINNWGKGIKLPSNLKASAEKLGVSEGELRSEDDHVWKSAVDRACKQKHVIITPAWLYLKDRISLMEQSTKLNTIVILTSDAYNDTQRRDTQSIVRHNITTRGLNYVYVVPDNCESERSLIRFVDSMKSDNCPGSVKIIRAPTTKTTSLQWKRIDHVMLLANVQGKIESLSDLAQLQIEEGYEQLYKASDQPHGEYAWKVLSVREMDYYKELLEEWSAAREDDEQQQGRRMDAPIASVETLVARSRASGSKANR